MAVKGQLTILKLECAGEQRRICPMPVYNEGEFLCEPWYMYIGFRVDGSVLLVLALHFSSAQFTM